MLPFLTVKVVLRGMRMLTVMFALIGTASGQETAFVPDYLPTDPAEYCSKTYEWTFGRSGQFIGEIIGTMTVPYTSGSLSGALLCHDDQTDTFFNDGVILKLLYFDDDYLSTDCALTADPCMLCLGLVQDGDILPLAPLGGVEIQKDKPLDPLECREGRGTNDWDDGLLFQIQDVTVQEVLYEKAVIVWGLQSPPEDSPKGPKSPKLDFFGKDVELGITLPKAKDTDHRKIDGFDVVGLGIGFIAGGDIDTETGKLINLWELTSVSCEGPTFTAIDVPFSSEIRTHSINIPGDIVGSYRDPYDSAGDLGVVHGFLQKSGVLTPIDFPGAVLTAAMGINDRGDIVGLYVFVEDGPRHGFLLSKDDVFPSPIDFPLATQTVARGINNQGDIVGSFRESGGRDGFLLSKDGGPTRIDVPGATQTVAAGINDQGDIVGSFRVGDWPTWVWHGFLLSKDGGFTPIDVPGASQTVAAGINDQGDIVGSFRESGGWHGFLLSKGGGFTPIDVPCATETLVRNTNNHGEIVGHFLDAEEVRFGFRLK